MLELTLDPHRETIRLAAAGEVDIATSGRLASELQRLIGDGFGRVVLDLREVSFIDSSGVRVILDARLRAQERGTAFELVRGAAVVERVLTIAGVTHALEFIEPREIDRPRGQGIT